eukprot:4762091-Alexandrium_andersonii.AAC.1
MSASLVGSEMCIRDSAWIGSACPYRSATCTASRPPGARTCLATPGLPLPVSYTHLTLPTICSV